MTTFTRENCISSSKLRILYVTFMTRNSLGFVDIHLPRRKEVYMWYVRFVVIGCIIFMSELSLYLRSEYIVFHIACERGNLLIV